MGVGNTVGVVEEPKHWSIQLIRNNFRVLGYCSRFILDFDFEFLVSFRFALRGYPSPNRLFLRVTCLYCRFLCENLEYLKVCRYLSTYRFHLKRVQRGVFIIIPPRTLGQVGTSVGTWVGSCKLAVDRKSKI